MSRDLLKRALDALEITHKASHYFVVEASQAIKAIKEELAKPSPEPVAWMKKHENGVVIFSLNPAEESDFTPLYAEPPASKLTKHDAEMLKCALEKLISVAEKCDSWESFPSKALDEAYAAIDSCSINRAI
jgi:hypothetical protein